MRARRGYLAHGGKYPTAAVEGTSGVHFKWLNIDLFLAQNIAGPGLTFTDKYRLLYFTNGISFLHSTSESGHLLITPLL